MRLLPREPSAAGFMLFSFALTALVVRPPLGVFSVSLALFLLHFFTFEETFSRFRRSPRKALPLIALNVAPYFLLPPFLKVSLPILIVPAFVLFLYLILRRVDEGLAYVAGSSIPTLTAFTVLYLWPSLTGLLLWYGLAVYVGATAAYIESKLPWRDVKPSLALVVWALVFPLLALKPLVSIACLEPTVKFLRNLRRNEKVDPRKLKEFGWKEMLRFVLYSALLTLALARP